MTTTEEVADTLAGFGLGLSPFADAPDQEAAVTVGNVRNAECWNEVIDQIVEICQLEEGWDGDGAPAPSKPLMASAMRLATALRGKNCPAPCRAVASFDGTVFFEWQDVGDLTELEIMSPDRAELTIHRAGRPTQRVKLP